MEGQKLSNIFSYDKSTSELINSSWEDKNKNWNELSTSKNIER